MSGSHDDRGRESRMMFRMPLAPDNVQPCLTVEAMFLEHRRPYADSNVAFYATVFLLSYSFVVVVTLLSIVIFITRPSPFAFVRRDVGISQSATWLERSLSRFKYGYATPPQTLLRETFQIRW